jgi:guanylate cyclase, other
MYGLLIQSIATLIKVKYGEEIWKLVRRKAKIDAQTFSTHQTYSETYITKIVKYLAEATGEKQDEVMEIMGADFVNFISNYGYDRILRVLGRHPRDFLNGLDNLHEYMKNSYPKMKAPSFYVEKENATGLILHYRTKRKGYVSYVKGLIKSVGTVFYDIEIEIDTLSEKMEADKLHVIFSLKFDNRHYDDSTSSLSLNSQLKPSHYTFKEIKGETFFSIFPFHIIFKSNMIITSVGESIKKVFQNIENEAISDIFNLIKPPVSFTWDNVSFMCIF